MPDKDKDPCDLLEGTPAYDYCAGDGSSREPPGGDGDGGVGLTDGASDHVKDLAEYLIEKINGLVAPNDAWAPEKADSGLYQPFLWLGEHLAVAIFVCVIVVCALTAWQGTPRLKQMGASTGWTLVAVAGMASVPGAVTMLNTAVSAGFTAAFDSDEGTLFGAIKKDLEHGADAGNPLGTLVIIAALVVALAFASLVFMTRQLGILVFVCMAPLVLASLARGGDMTAVKRWAQRLLGLMFAPFALLLVGPFVKPFGGALVMDAVLLIFADALMLRMIFHGVPYFGPKIAGAARGLVERNTTNPLARAVVRAGSPDVYEQETTPRGPRTVDTPGRAASQDRGVLFAAYGIKQQQRPGRLTTASMSEKIGRDTARTAQLTQARRQARASGQPQAPGTQPQAANRRAQGPNPSPAPNRPAPGPAPAPNPRPTPNRPPSGPTTP